jgi:hypothetical protein
MRNAECGAKFKRIDREIHQTREKRLFVRVFSVVRGLNFGHKC